MQPDIQAQFSSAIALRRAFTEERISELLNDFAMGTGMTVDSIKVSHLEYFGGGRDHVVHLSVSKPT